MNTYLYSWCDDEHLAIGKIMARSLKDCERKIIEKFCNKYDDLDDTLEYEDFLKQLSDETTICIGNIYEIDEFM